MSRYRCAFHGGLAFDAVRLPDHAACLHAGHVELIEPTPAAHRDHIHVETVEPTLFDLTEGRRLRDEGMARADQAAPKPWKDSADDAIAHLARTHGGEFTSDDVWRILDEWGIPRPPEGRALGPRMTAARNRGIITFTGRYQPTEQTKSHGSPAAIYTRGENL